MFQEMYNENLFLNKSKSLFDRYAPSNAKAMTAFNLRPPVVHTLYEGNSIALVTNNYHQ